MSTVLVNGPLEVNGRRYEPGDTVDHLPELVIERLVLHGHAVSDEEAPAPEPVVAASTLVLRAQLEAKGIVYVEGESDDDLQKRLDDANAPVVTPAADLTKAQLQAELSAAGRPFAKKDGHPKLVALVEALRAEAPAE